ncbi:hypothetical protein Misp04_00860 [Micromonospora sp. NBRC 101691]|nr:hypothetical protein Misp04_00860 [Micromonospora sp. NBRC 101691]
MGRRYVVRVAQPVAAFGVRLGDRDHAGLLRVFQTPLRVRVRAASSGAEHEQSRRRRSRWHRACHVDHPFADHLSDPEVRPETM